MGPDEFGDRPYAFRFEVGKVAENWDGATKASQ
jgi:hypothetical protein